MNTMIIFNLLIGLVCLIGGGELLVRGASKIATLFGIPSIVIGLTVVAFGTSAPELAVSLQAALKGNADIAIANVVGSNIFNTLGILGLSALVAPLVVHLQVVKREVPFMIGASILLLVLCWNGHLSKIEGLLLFTILVLYLGWLVREALAEKSQETRQSFSLKAVMLPSLFLVGGLAIIMIGADKLVIGASELARSLGVSDAVIGLTIVSIGTSLPEVVASVIATFKGERDIAIGNVIGSNIFNILCILGITATIEELEVSTSMLKLDIPVMIGVSILTLGFFKRGLKMTRPVAVFYLILYTAYTGYLIQFAN